MRINHNIAALNTHRQLNTASTAQSKSMEKLSSGLRINKAGDDAAGLAISEKMRGQIRGLDMASKNAQDGISMIQTAEGALSETHDILQRMRELSVQASNDTATDDDRAALQDEVKQLKSEIDRIGNSTEFNTKKLINGDLSGSQLGGLGSKIGTATSASLNLTFDPDKFSATGSQSLTVSVDGKNFKLDGVTGADAFEWVSNFKTELASAMSGSGIEVPDVDIKNIEDQNTMDLVITSKATGTASNIDVKFNYDDGNTNADFGDADTIQSLLQGSAASQGSDGKFDSEVVLSSEKLELDVNGTKINVSLTDNTYADDSEMATAATQLQSDINTALNNYKNQTGTDYGTVTVSVKDGAFKIESSNSENIDLKVATDATSTKLGLAGTETAANGGLNFHIGANKGQNISLQINDMTTKGLNIADLDISNRAGADNSIKSLDAAIKSVSTERSKLGAVQNRLEHTINNLNTSSENLTAAESRIRDVDMAKEMMEQTKNSILSQAAQAMLAQANQQPQGVLQLLR